MAHAFQLHESCRLKVDLPKYGLRVGAAGTIVYVLSESAGAYMVEFPGADVFSSQVLDLNAADLEASSSESLSTQKKNQKQSEDQ